MRINESVGETLLFYLGLAAVIWMVRGWILAGSYGFTMVVPIGFTLVAIAGLILGDWRKGLYGFVAWLLFEDEIRKYLGNNMAIYFAKDALLGITYLSFLLARTREERVKFRPAFLYPLCLLIGLGIVQAFNPDSPSMLYGILGLKVDFYYIPLMF